MRAIATKKLGVGCPMNKPKQSSHKLVDSVQFSAVPNVQTSNIDNGEQNLSDTAQQLRSTYDLKVLIGEYQRSFMNVQEEVSMWIEDEMITGEIPKDIQGTQFRNGPAFFERNGVRQNFLDGDGMINKFSIKDGKFHYMNKFIRTKEFLEEEAAKKFLYRTIFSNNDYVDIFNTLQINGLFKNAANTGVVCWAGKLFALHETSPPYELDPYSLQTLGKSDVFGTLPENEDPFAAHFRIFTEKNNSKRWITFQPKIENLDSNIEFLEYTEYGRLIHKLQYQIPNAAFGFFHDLLITQNYYILYENPTKLDFVKFMQYLLNQCASSELFQYQRELPGRFHFVPRPGKLGKGVKVINVPNGFIFHQANAYETNNGKFIVLDAIAINEVDLKTIVDNQNPDYFKLNQPPYLKRHVFDIEKQILVEDAVLASNACENPQINPEFAGRPNQFTYTFGTSKVPEPFLWAPFQIISKISTPFFQTGVQFKNRHVNNVHNVHNNNGYVVYKNEQYEYVDNVRNFLNLNNQKVEIDSWFAGDRKFVSEAIFIPRKNSSKYDEDDGYVSTLVYTPHEGKTEFVILDAKRVSDGPVATIRLPIFVPIVLHGSWCDKYYGL